MKALKMLKRQEYNLDGLHCPGCRGLNPLYDYSCPDEYDHRGIKFFGYGHKEKCFIDSAIKELEDLIYFRMKTNDT